MGSEMCIRDSLEDCSILMVGGKKKLLRKQMLSSSLLPPTVNQNKDPWKLQGGSEPFKQANTVDIMTSSNCQSNQRPLEATARVETEGVPGLEQLTVPRTCRKHFVRRQSEVQILLLQDLKRKKEA